MLTTRELRAELFKVEDQDAPVDLHALLGLVIAELDARGNGQAATTLAHARHNIPMHTLNPQASDR